MDQTIRKLSVYALAAAVLTAGNVPAQTFLSKPIRWIIPYPAGGTGDLLVRTVSGPMTKSL